MNMVEYGKMMQNHKFVRHVPPKALLLRPWWCPEKRLVTSKTNEIEMESMESKHIQTYPNPSGSKFLTLMLQQLSCFVIYLFNSQSSAPRSCTSIFPIFPRTSWQLSQDNQLARSTTRNTIDVNKIKDISNIPHSPLFTTPSCPKRWRDYMRGLSPAASINKKLYTVKIHVQCRYCENIQYIPILQHYLAVQSQTVIAFYFRRPLGLNLLILAILELVATICQEFFPCFQHGERDWPVKH